MNKQAVQDIDCHLDGLGLPQINTPSSWPMSAARAPGLNSNHRYGAAGSRVGLSLLVFTNKVLEASAPSKLPYDVCSSIAP